MCSTCGCGDHTHDHLVASMPPQQHARMVEVERNLLEKNDRYASENRRLLSDRQIAAFNLVSSPGSGKTSLLVRTIEAMKNQHRVAVIEGDQQTDQDARRIEATGAPAIQINTGKGCHLDAHAVSHALEKLPLDKLEYLFIENVGNLVCPSAFDLGEEAKILVLSTTEGEDKPLKYPDMFRASELLLINKTDLLPHLDFDLEQCIRYARRIQPDIQVITLSAKTGEGFEEWLDWLDQKR